MDPAISKYLIQYPYYCLTGQRLKSLIRQFEKSQWDSYEVLQEIQWKRLKLLLRYVYENIPFYRKQFQNTRLHPNDINTKDDLLNIPVLTRESIKNNFEELKCTTKRLKEFPRETSGSSGSPLRLIKDSISLATMDAIMYRNYSWFGIDIGQKQARYWGSSLDGLGKVKVKLRDFLLNRIRFSPFDLSEKAYDRFIVRLNRFKPVFVYGYSQTIYEFSNHIMRKGTDFPNLKFKAVILTGEMISDDQIKTIEDAFKCDISNEYGCTEVGIIAMECPCKGMHLMIENLLIEFVKDGKHVLPGEEGEIIVTELYGNLMPLIRYQVGDIGSPIDKLCQCGRGLPLLGRLKGRIDEFIICPDGKQVDPIVFEYILKEIPSKYGRIEQFRIIQESVSKLNIEVRYGGDEPEVMLGKIERKLKKVIGGEFEINFRLADYIPVEASGKLRCFISHTEGGNNL